MKDKSPKTSNSIFEKRLLRVSQLNLSANGKMTFEDAMEKLQTEGFSWHAFQQFFPFGDLSLREGEHERLVCAVLDILSTEYERELFISLLDTQICVYWEQLWIQDEMQQRLGLEPKFEGENHFALARLQINGNIRRRYGLKRKYVRETIMGIGGEEMLLDRITNATDGLKREVG